jgi:hypothetical protein
MMRHIQPVVSYFKDRTHLQLNKHFALCTGINLTLVLCKGRCLLVLCKGLLCVGLLCDHAACCMLQPGIPFMSNEALVLLCVLLYSV